ncbi:hypothetical protein SOVF_016870 isoform A, partial [Spinacia oleracea]
FKILAFLLNQFGGKVPGSIPEIKNFAFTRFKAEYHLFCKLDVNLPNAVIVYSSSSSVLRSL